MYTPWARTAGPMVPGAALWDLWYIPYRDIYIYIYIHTCISYIYFSDIDFIIIECSLSPGSLNTELSVIQTC